MFTYALFYFFLLSSYIPAYASIADSYLDGLEDDGWVTVDHDNPLYKQLNDLRQQAREHARFKQQQAEIMQKYMGDLTQTNQQVQQLSQEISNSRQQHACIVNDYRKKLAQKDETVKSYMQELAQRGERIAQLLHEIDCVKRQYARELTQKDECIEQQYQELVKFVKLKQLHDQVITTLHKVCTAINGLQTRKNELRNNLGAFTNIMEEQSLEREEREYLASLPGLFAEYLANS